MLRGILKARTVMYPWRFDNLARVYGLKPTCQQHFQTRTWLVSVKRSWHLRGGCLASAILRARFTQFLTTNHVYLDWPCTRCMLPKRTGSSGHIRDNRFACVQDGIANLQRIVQLWDHIADHRKPQ